MESAKAVFDEMLYRNLISWNMMIDGYVKNGNIGAALKVFDTMPERDLFSWNLMIDGLSKDHQIEFARQLFDKMPERDVITWNSMIDGYAKCGNMKTANELFDQVPFKDEVTWGIMINGYANSNQIGLAHCWFEKMPYKNLITWNCLLGGYAKCGDVRAAHQLFNSMPFRNLTSWNTMLDAYAKHGKMELAFQLFNLMPLKDVVSWNILIDGHNKIGNVQLAEELFDIMPYRDVVSWNLMLSGYKENGLLKKAVDLFFHMHLLGEKPDCFTLAIVLSAIADLGLIVQGRWVHAYAERSKFSLDGNIGVSLIDMYSKSGYVDLALNIFDNIQLRNIDHWNAMISGLAIHGYGIMLSLCLKIQHYGCMVDLLGRAGFLEAAVRIVNSMPMTPNDVVWRALLGASRSHGNLEIAEHAARRLINMVPHDSSSFVLLSSIYVYKGQFKSARDVWKIMKENGVLKNPGLSYIELNGFLHEFSAGDTSHPQTMEIYLILKCMIPALMLAVSSSETSFATVCVRKIGYHRDLQTKEKAVEMMMGPISWFLNDRRWSKINVLHVASNHFLGDLESDQPQIGKGELPKRRAAEASNNTYYVFKGGFAKQKLLSLTVDLVRSNPLLKPWCGGCEEDAKARLTPEFISEC
uniref:Pentatricopeptide repeat-containing protein n=1 Tax=Ananas comosus var. bracteatus TaxID=296719 RepID=A0A6V7QJ49_ANACO|nr:unnamed protein product [Ananas comosus var. bracteatus]